MTDAKQKLVRVPGTSLHRQLYLVLRDGILSQLWPPGTPLPTEDALCAQFSVSRVTVRRALADLAAQGLILRKHGSGTYANPEALSAPRLNPNLTMVEELRLSHSETTVKVVDVRREVPPVAIAGLLQLAGEEAAVHALRLRSVGGTPVMLTDAWVPEKYGRKVTGAALEKKALYELLLAQGVVFGRVIQDVSAEAAPPARASLMQTEVGAPLIKITRLLHSPQDIPVQHITVYLSPERSRMLMEIPGEAMNTLSAGQFVHDGVEQPRRKGRRSS